MSATAGSFWKPWKGYWKSRPGNAPRTRDLTWTGVACLGCCALAPVVKVDEDIYGNMAVIKIKELLEKYE